MDTMTVLSDPRQPRLPRSVPEAQGVASFAVLTFVEEADRTLDSLHSLMLLRHGHVVAEGWWSPYRPERPHMLFSLSKSFTSTAAGLAIAEKRLSLDDPVLGFFPDEAPAEVSENLAAMRVRHLLSMSTGHAEDTTGALRQDPNGDWVRAFLAQPVQHVPGTHFLYNSGATYMVAAILHKVTGTTLLDYLQPRLFAPLGIIAPTWESCPRGIQVGGWGLSLTTEDIARFGQLYLQKGVWNDARLLPEAWVEEATVRQVANGDNPESDWSQGYGYQFWRCRHGAYRGDGAFGQYCLVLPEQDAVLAITAGLGDMQAVLNLVWQSLLPAMAPSSLPEAPQAHGTLHHTLGALTLRPAEGQPSAAMAAEVSGRTYRFEPNDPNRSDWMAIWFAFGDSESLVRIETEQGENRIAIGHAGAWIEGTARLDRPDPQPIAASGAWTNADTYLVKLAHCESAFVTTITCRFLGKRVLVARRVNVAFGPTERPQLVGSV